MTPQSNFMVAAPILPGRDVDLRDLLLTMNINGLPGMADPENLLVPFGVFRTLHFARFVILNDTTLGDLEAYGERFPNAPIYLAFLGDCDGSAGALLADLANRAGAGLRQIFAHCEGYDPNGDLLQWMRSHSVKPAINYVNWIGRTVRHIREDAELHELLATYLAGLSIDDPPRKLHAELARAVAKREPLLTPEAPTPIAWWARRLLCISAAALTVYVVLLPLLALTIGAALLVYSAVLVIAAAALAAFLVQLRRHETMDPDVQSPPKPPSDKHLAELGRLQDHDVTNQYTAFGSFKPGPFPRWTTTVVWWLVNLATPVFYSRGNLARIKSIHFARWVFLDGKRRGLFASNYDGSSESYMDDFVNKVAFGLNLTFGQGIGYPRTRFLLWEGGQREQEFKDIQRRNALPTEVWYNAYPGLSLFDIQRNARIRQGLLPMRFCQKLKRKTKTMTETEIRQWLAEI